MYKRQEYNYGYKDTLHVGNIDLGEEVVQRLEKGRAAQRISFGVFFNF